MVSAVRQRAFPNSCQERGSETRDHTGPYKRTPIHDRRGYTTTVTVRNEDSCTVIGFYSEPAINTTAGINYVPDQRSQTRSACAASPTINLTSESHPTSRFQIRVRSSKDFSNQINQGLVVYDPELRCAAIHS